MKARLAAVVMLCAVAVAVAASLRLPPREPWALVAFAVAATASLAYAVRTSELSARAGELQRLNQQLAESSEADSLTGLRNRRFLFERVGPALSAASHGLALARRRGEATPEATAVLLLVDLDHFKTVNDTHGHRVGDEILVDVAVRLRRIVRAEDAVIRWGGDELLIVTRDTSPEAGALMAERIRTAVAAEPVPVSTGQALTVSCTVGFACFPFLAGAPGAGTWEDVLGLADLALYAAKREARNSWAGCVAGPHATTEMFVNGGRESRRFVDDRVVELRRSGGRAA